MRHVEPPEEIDPIVLHAPTRKRIGIFGVVRSDVVATIRSVIPVIDSAFNSIKPIFLFLKYQGQINN